MTTTTTARNGHQTVLGVLDRVPVDQISERASQIRFGRFVLALIALPLMLAGWAAAMTLPMIWKAGRWCAGAVLTGWDSVGAPSLRAQNAELREQVNELRLAVERLGGP